MKVARIQLQTLSQLEPAVKTLRRVIAADPKLAEAHYYLGLAHKDQGHAPAAKQELSTYLRLAPEGELAAEAKTVLQDLESP
jgi:regulator of sirC expression with transglutaminase-like and TPR domain